MLLLLLRRLRAPGVVLLETIPGRHQEEPIHLRTQQDQRGGVVITGGQVVNGWDLEMGVMVVGMYCFCYSVYHVEQCFVWHKQTRLLPGFGLEMGVGI